MSYLKKILTYCIETIVGFMFAIIFTAFVFCIGILFYILYVFLYVVSKFL